VSGLALALVLGSAVAHAAWNFLAKRSGGGAGVVWLYTALSSVIYAPAAIVAFLIERPSLGAAELGFIAGTSVLHACYFVSLQKGYQASDLSLVYPLSRGSGPLLASIGAVVLLGEDPTPLTIAGVLLVAVGALSLTRAESRRPETVTAGLFFGLLTGVLIATYTLWDKHAVDALAIPPLIYDWTNNIGRTLLLAPLGLRHRQEVSRLWHTRRRHVVGIAILAPLAYIMVLSALAFTPVTYVAPAREVSIILGTLLGARVLAEGDTARRVIAATTIVVGVAALAIPAR